MKKYTLEYVIKKLIKRKYLLNQTMFELQVDDRTTYVNRRSLNNDPKLLLPVTGVYVTTHYNNSKKPLCDLNNNIISFLFSYDTLEHAIKDHYSSVQDVYSKFTIRITCKRLPNIFMMSYLYEWINPDIFLALMHFKNTVISRTTYNNCINYICKNKSDIIKKYRLRRNGDEYGATFTPHEILEGSLSAVCGFKIKIREEMQVTPDSGLIIEATE